MQNYTSKRIGFKKLDTTEEFLHKLETHMLTDRHASEYYTMMTVKMARMIIRKYGTTDVNVDFGKRVYADMVKERKKDNYIRNILKTIEAMGGHTFKLPKPRHGDYRVEYLSPGEARALLSAAYDLRDRAMLALMLWTGIRNRELLNANINDYDSRQRIFWIRNNLDEDIKYHGTKNGKEQFVAVPPEAAKYLDAYIGERPQVVTRALFITRDCRRFSARGLNDMIARTCQRARIKVVSSHILRHTMITLACAAGENLTFVQRQARHSSPLVTERVYAHAAANPEMLRAAVDQAAKSMF